MQRRSGIPVIDIFAGPGGLGEGFTALTDRLGVRPFRTGLSIEKDSIAHRTLTLRSFFRQFPPGEAPDAYYHRLEGRITTEDLFNQYPEQSNAAHVESWKATLGDPQSGPSAELRERVGEPCGLQFQGCLSNFENHRGTQEIGSAKGERCAA